MVLRQKFKIIFEKFVNLSMISMSEIYYDILIKGNLRLALGLFLFGDIKNSFLSIGHNFSQLNLNPKSEYKAVGEQFML